MTNIDKQLQEKIFEEVYQFQKVFQPSPLDIPIIDLYEYYKAGKIDPEPEYQRKFVWTKAKQSYFIESLIYGIDTPIIYFIEAEKEVNGHKKIVREAIDGRQRLSTIFEFYDNTLKLEGLKENTPFYNNLNGKTYKELNEKFQRTFKQYTIRTTTFKLVDRSIDLDTQLKFKYQLFHRYNSGLTALNQQEVRNCQCSQDDIYQLLKNLSQSEEFKKVCPFFKEEQRQADIEFVILLYLLTLFDDSLEYYAKKSKNPFINAYFERIDLNIYNLDSENEDIDVDDEDEEAAEDEDDKGEDDKDEQKKRVMEKIGLSIKENLKKVSLIYGRFLKGTRTERYLIETLYYHFSKDKRLTKSFLENNADDLGKFIDTRLKTIENTPDKPGQEYNLIDCYKEKVTHTVRVRYRFNEMKKIIDEYFQEVN